MDHELRRLVRAARRLIEVITLIALLPLVGCAVAVLASIVALATGRVPS